MDPGWLCFVPDPSKPRYQPMPGAVDAHCHVFGPADEFQYAPGRKYTPCDASKRQLAALHAHLGFERCVIVQATCHGTDNAALVDALRHSRESARGVASLSPDIGDAELRELHDAGVRGVRFAFIKRLVDDTPAETVLSLATRIAPLGWHVVMYLEAPDLERLWPLIAAMPTPVVVDHMGRPDVSLPVDGPAFERFVRLMREQPHVWTKVTCPERLSAQGPPWDDFVPFARRLVETFPDRVLWGTDWPHPNLTSHMPDDGELVDLIPRIAPTDELRRRLLVDNPVRLYWSPVP